MELNFLQKIHLCKTRNMSTNFSKSHKNKDQFAWRCMNKSYHQYNKYFSIRKGSFFENFRLPFKDILQLIIRYCCIQQLCSIICSLNLAKTTVINILEIGYVYSYY
ncbi:hypothetical protein H312_01139 [Anncaliia algerae PRA339]|uniref:Uncharacterized protein n=1 Tax=Anncaliia algerae PRA339 TaxID=1288291 RepID=A0A059F3C3_9MICR|nr:hypothetical protein H312_01139 [Anncaliia algerae PRA339]